MSGSYIKFTEFMSDNTPESNQDSGSDTSSETKSFSEKYSDVMGKVNETLGNVDWTQMGKYGKAAGIIAVVVIAQIIIKVVIDTIKLFSNSSWFTRTTRCNCRWSMELAKSSYQ